MDLSPLDIAAPYAKLVTLLESALISEGAEGRLKKGALDLQNRQESMASLTESASNASLETISDDSSNDLTPADSQEDVTSIAGNHFVKMDQAEKLRPVLPQAPPAALAQAGSRLSSLRNIFESVNDVEKQKAEESARRLPPPSLKLAKKPTISVPASPKVEEKAASVVEETPSIETTTIVQEEVKIPEQVIVEEVKVEARPLPNCPATLPEPAEVAIQELAVPVLPEKDITFTLPPLPHSRSVSPAKSMVAIQHAPSVRLWDGTKVRPNRANAARCASPERNEYVQFGVCPFFSTPNEEILTLLDNRLTWLHCQKRQPQWHQANSCFALAI